MAHEVSKASDMLIERQSSVLLSPPPYGTLPKRRRLTIKGVRSHER